MQTINKTGHFHVLRIFFNRLLSLVLVNLIITTDTHCCCCCGSSLIRSSSYYYTMHRVDCKTRPPLIWCTCLLLLQPVSLWLDTSSRQPASARTIIIIVIPYKQHFSTSLTGGLSVGRSVGRDTAMSGGLRQKAASNNIEETWNKHSPRTLTHSQCGYIMYLNLSLFFFVSPIPPPFLLLFLLLPIHRARTAPASFVALCMIIWVLQMHQYHRKHCSSIDRSSQCCTYT